MNRFIVFIFIILSLVGCNKSPIIEEKFDEFFSQFVSDKDFELSRISYPLASYRYEYGVDENGNDDATAIKTDVTKETISKQETLKKYQSQHGLVFELLPNETSSDVQVVKLYKPDSDWLIEYHFMYSQDGWILVATYDYSL